MIKLKHVFLVALSCVSLNIIGSVESSNKDSDFKAVTEGQAQQQSTSTDSMPPLKELCVNDSTSQAKTSSSIFNWFGAGQTSTPSVKTSTAATEIYYGAQRTVGGRSATAILMEKYKSGQLKGDLQTKPTKATADLSLALDQRINGRDAFSIENQKKTAEIFTIVEQLSQETGIALTLDPTSADGLKKKQQEHIQAITIDAVTKMKECDNACAQAIANALAIKEQKMQDLLNLLQCAANNRNKLHKMSQKSDDFLLSEDIHYQDMNSFQAHLEVNGNPDINVQNTYEAKLLAEDQKIKDAIKQSLATSAAMASVIGNQRKNNQTVDELHQITHAKNFSTTKPYLELLNTTSKKHKAEKNDMVANK